MARLDGHRTAELRSLADHRLVAQKLRDDPELIARARAKLDAVLADAAPGSGAAQEARDHRQASPFAGALSARERWQLWRDAATASIGTER